MKAVNDKVEALEAQCAATVGEKKRLADEAATTASRLVRAEKLTSGLASEGVRWMNSLENLGKQKVKAYHLVVYNCPRLLISAHIDSHHGRRWSTLYAFEYERVLSIVFLALHAEYSTSYCCHRKDVGNVFTLDVHTLTPALLPQTLVPTLTTMGQGGLDRRRFFILRVLVLLRPLHGWLS